MAQAEPGSHFPPQAQLLPFSVHQTRLPPPDRSPALGPTPLPVSDLRRADSVLVVHQEQRRAEGLASWVEPYEREGSEHVTEMLKPPLKYNQMKKSAFTRIPLRESTPCDWKGCFNCVWRKGQDPSPAQGPGLRSPGWLPALSSGLGPVQTGHLFSA